MRSATGTRRHRGWVTLAAVIAALTLLPAVPAAAAPPPASCFQTTCNGKDPQAAGCGGGAVTYYEYTYVGYRVEHRYSQLCGAVWTRATYVSGNAWTFYAYLESKVGSGTVQQRVQWNGNTGWSKMYAFSAWSRSCAVSNTGSHCGPYV